MAFDSKDFDNFWNIESLVPKKKKQLTPFATRPSTATVEIDGDAEQVDKARTSLTAQRGMRATEDESYVPDGHGLISRVTVKHLRDRYDFYENFRRAALLYFDCRGERCDFVPFYSYMPQYSQLSLEQRSYYLYFRERIRCGEYIKTDYSYIYLFVYEILNLPDKIPPRDGLLQLIRLLREYRRQFPRIEAQLALWIEDYCLVHRLPCPVSELGDMLHSVISISRLKEFYFGGLDFDSREVVDAMVAHLSDYDPRRAKIFEGENRELLWQNFRGAMRAVLVYLKKSGELMPEDERKILLRDAFPASLCTHTVKSKLEIEYFALDTCDSLRREVTAAVRYTENMLRAVMGVKSRLGVTGLPDILKREIDEYFARQRMQGGTLAPKRELPEYEKLYSAPAGNLSASGADEIERASWSTTMRLVEYDDDAPQIAVAEPEIIEEAPAATPASTESPLSDSDVEFLRRAYAYTYDGGAGSDDHTTAEGINERALDLIGDVVLEYDGEYYRIIEDYKEDIEEWIK